MSEPIATVGAPLQCRGGALRSDADVAAYAGCDSIHGDLRIRQTTLTNLDGLSRLHHVSGTLEISGNPELDDLRGLARLTSVGALEVRGNADLDTLRGLENLRSAAAITVTDNRDLESLRGLDGLQKADSIRIERNGIFATVGLSKLIEVGGLVIRDNPKLISLKGLEGLKRARSVDIQGNPRLAAYYGLLPELQWVEQQLVLRHNAGLSQREVRSVINRVERASAQPTVVAREAQRAASLR